MKIRVDNQGYNSVFKLFECYLVADVLDKIDENSYENIIIDCNNNAVIAVELEVGNGLPSIKLLFRFSNDKMCLDINKFKMHDIYVNDSEFGNHSTELEYNISAIFHYGNFGRNVYDSTSADIRTSFASIIKEYLKNFDIKFKD